MGETPSPPHSQGGRTPGSDGRRGDDFVEIRTISPEKGCDKVMVRRGGNFSKLIVVRISGDFQFESRIIDRSAFCKGKNKGTAKVSWESMPVPDEPKRDDEYTGLGPAWLYDYIREKEADEKRVQAANAGAQGRKTQDLRTNL